MAATKPVGMVSSTSPLGKKEKFGKGLDGPELIRGVANPSAYIARASISNPILLQKSIEKAIDAQQKGNFSFLEILSICPTNWKTNAKDSFAKLRQAEQIYPVMEAK